MDAARKLGFVVGVFLGLLFFIGCERHGGLAPTVHDCKSRFDQATCIQHESCEWTDQGCKAK